MGKKIKEEEKIFSDFFVNFQQSTNKVVVLAQAAQQSGNRTEEKAPNKRSTAADHTTDLKLNIVISSICTYLAGEILVYVYDKYSKANEGRTTSLYHIIIRLLQLYFIFYFFPS